MMNKTMKSKSTLLLALFFAVSNSAWAIIPANLVKKGGGEVRYLKVIKVYDAALYTLDGARKQDILKPNTSRCIAIDYKVNLSVDKFILAAQTVLNRQHDADRLKAVKPQIEQLHSKYTDIKKGDNYTMCYDGKSRNTLLSLNGKAVSRIPQSADFADIYMGMWLGEKMPISVPLRNNMIANLK